MPSIINPSVLSPDSVPRVNEDIKSSGILYLSQSHRDVEGLVHFRPCCVV